MTNTSFLDELEDQLFNKKSKTGGVLILDFGSQYTINC